jgi:ADP-ribosyl-[dinitrogen reductase] hydrolase
MIDPAVIDRAKGALVGLAVGDALGTTVEFKPRGTFPPVADMVGGGAFELPAGAWTDDTSMALCLADSLVFCKAFDPENIMNRFVNWMDYGHNSVTGTCFDIGNITRAVLQRYKSEGLAIQAPAAPHMAGNGSIMRLTPAVLACLNDRPMAVELSVEQSRLTHAAPETLDACRLMGGLLYDLIHQSAARGDMAIEEPKILDLQSGRYRLKSREEISSTGYVVHTLEAALWAVSQTNNFQDAVLLAVNLGDDADTVGAVTGQIAGAKWGYTSIPQPWLDRLAWREKIEETAVSLASVDLRSKPSVRAGLTPAPSIS